MTDLVIKLTEAATTAIASRQEAITTVGSGNDKARIPSVVEVGTRAVPVMDAQRSVWRYAWSARSALCASADMPTSEAEDSSMIAPSSRAAKCWQMVASHARMKHSVKLSGEA